MEEDSQAVADHLSVWDLLKLWFLHKTEKNGYDVCVEFPLKGVGTFCFALAMWPSF